MYRFDNTGQSPLRAEQTVTVQPPLVIQAPVEDIYSYHAGIHGVGVLPHSSFDHSIPGMHQTNAEAEHRVSASVQGIQLCRAK